MAAPVFGDRRFRHTQGDAIRFERSQAALSTRCSRHAGHHYDDTFAQIRFSFTVSAGSSPKIRLVFQGRSVQYQREALGWFAFLRRFDFGGCLADDMGLGQTVMVLALLDARRQVKSAEEKRAVDRGCSAVAGVQLARRSDAVRSHVEGGGLHGSAARCGVTPRV